MQWRRGCAGCGYSANVPATPRWSLCGIIISALVGTYEYAFSGTTTNNKERFTLIYLY